MVVDGPSVELGIDVSKSIFRFESYDSCEWIRWILFLSNAPNCWVVVSSGGVCVDITISTLVSTVVSWVSLEPWLFCESADIDWTIELCCASSILEFSKPGPDCESTGRTFDSSSAGLFPVAAWMKVYYKDKKLLKTNQCTCQ